MVLKLKVSNFQILRLLTFMIHIYLFFIQQLIKKCLPSDICTQYSFCHICVWYMYACAYTCLRHWIRSWCTRREQCSVFSCNHKSNLRSEITSPISKIWMCFQSSHIGSKSRKKRMFHFTRCFIYTMQALVPVFSCDYDLLTPRLSFTQLLQFSCKGLKTTAYETADEKERAKLSPGIITRQSMKSRSLCVQKKSSPHGAEVAQPGMKISHV